MEASASTREAAPPGASVPARATVQSGHGDPGLALLFLGGVLAIYLAIGYAIYTLIAALG